MNMGELAAILNTSKVTLYRRVKGAGINLDTIRSADGDLTPEAIASISALFDKVDTADTAKPKASPRATGKAFDSNDADAVKLAALERERELLLDQINDLRDQISDLRAQRDQLQQQHADNMQRMTEQVNAWKAQAERVQLLLEAPKQAPAPEGHTVRGFFASILGHGKKGGQE